MAPHSSTLAWRIPGTGEPGGLPSVGSHRVRHDWSDLAAAATAGVYSHKGIIHGRKASICLSCCFCCFLASKSYPTLLQPHRLYPSRLLCQWNFPGKDPGVGCHILLQGIFQTQGLNPHLLHWQADSLLLNHQASHTRNIIHKYSSAY